MNNVVVRYFIESLEEFRRVTWPTQHQSIRLMMIVISFTILTAILVAVLDYAFNLGYTILTTPN